MIRFSTILWIAAVALAGFAMFRVKYEVMQQEQLLARLDHRIAEGHEAIRVLNAEWSYLTQPARLDLLAKRYLDLAPIRTQQILSSIDQLPMRPAAARAPDAQSRETIARAGARPAAGPSRGAP